MGRGVARTIDFNWDTINFEEPNLEILGDPFSEEDVFMAIKLIPCDKALGPDGFTGGPSSRSVG
jgi:hypothetical protein